MRSWIVLAIALLGSLGQARVAPVAVSGDRIFVGLAKGRIGVFGGPDLALKERIETGSASIQALAVHGDDLAWLANDPANPTLNVRRNGETATTPWPGLSRKATLAWCGDDPLVVGERGIYTVRGGNPIAWKEVVLDKLKPSLEGAFVRVYGDIALAIRPYAIDRESKTVCMASAIDLAGREPKLLGGLATTAPEVVLGGYHLDRRGRIATLGSWDLRQPNVVPDGGAFVFQEPAGNVRVDFRDPNWVAQRNAALPAVAVMPTLEKGRITLTDPKSGRQFALMPWNQPRKPEAILEIQGRPFFLEGERLCELPSAPDPQNGYAGFVRVPIGEDVAVPPNPKAERLWQEIQSWQGTPYLWGGESREGVDCSGFVMNAFRAIGISLPHQSQEIAKSRRGSRVYDELRYGDVLVYPGHVAIYIGNGRTAETTDGGVGTSSIWSRTDVKIIRFLSG